MDSFIRYDHWCLGNTRATLLWIEEWLSLSQRRIEYMMILFYGFTAGISVVVSAIRPYGSSLVGMSIFMFALIVWSMFRMSNVPDVVRKHRSNDDISLIRLALQILMWGAVVWEVVVFHRTHAPIVDLAEPARNVDYVLFVYSISVSTKGEKGRRRKLALEKLKELFGTDWMPKPLGAHG